MATPAYVDGATDMQVGIASAESGIKVSSVDQSIDNPKAYSYDHVGTQDGYAYGWNPSSTMTVTGEVSAATTDLVPNTSEANAWGSTITIANATTSYAGLTFSTWSLDSVRLSQTRAPGFKSLTASYSSFPDITVPAPT